MKKCEVCDDGKGGPSNCGECDRKFVRGEQQGSAKLTISRVKEIKFLGALGESQRQLAFKYGVSRSTIRDILIGKTWAKALAAWEGKP